MLPLLEERRDDIARLCRSFNVRKLEVFGSAARGADFDLSRSDVDFLVSYDFRTPGPDLAAHFELRDQLAELLARPVDLVMAGAVRNPFLRAEIERSKRVLYAT